MEQLVDLSLMPAESSPQIAVIDVNTTGRKRVSPAIAIASSIECPSCRN